jgi:hypothetical protein
MVEGTSRNESETSKRVPEIGFGITNRALSDDVVSKSIKICKLEGGRVVDGVCKFVVRLGFIGVIF